MSLAADPDRPSPPAPPSARPGPGAIAWLLPTLGGLLAAYAFFHVLFPATEWLYARDGDVGRHVRVGTWILDNRRIPFEDLFSHTMRGADFVPYEWLSEVAYAAAHAAGGLAGVTLLAAALFAGACALVYRTTVGLGVGRPLAFATGFASLLLQNSHLLARPHLFTTLLVAVTFALLLEHRRSGRALCAWAVPVLVLVWANLHGGFLIAFLLLGVFGLDAGRGVLLGGGPDARARLRTLAAVTVASLVACLVNPAGAAILPHTTGYLRSEYLVDVTREYQSPDFHEPGDQVFLVVLLGGAALLMTGRARPTFVEGAMYVLWTAASLHSARNIPVFAVVVLPGVAAWASRTVASLATDAPAGVRRVADAWRRWEARISRTDATLARPLALAAVLAGLAAVALGPARERYRFSPDVFPVQGLEAARRLEVSGPVFNQFIWGGYLLYAAWPDVPVFIDGQTDFYGETLTREYVRVLGLHAGWEDVLDRYGVDWTLTETDAPLNQALALSPAWKLAHRDPTATVFVRRR